MVGMLEHKVAIITGGASGIGAAGVDLFVREGATVIVAELHLEDGGAIEAQYSGRARAIRCDVTSTQDVANLIAAVDRDFGRLDILYNNAGGGSSPGSLLDISDADWEANMALMLKSVMLTARAAVPLMRRSGGGSIINTASIAGLRTGISGIPYSVAKAAMLHFTQMAAVELGMIGIRVNTICPGIIPTPALASAFGLSAEVTRRIMPGVTEIFGKAQPIRRAGTPTDIARAALFFASDLSSFVTGQNLSVDGGLSQMGPATLEVTQPGSVVALVSELVRNALADTH